MAGPLLGSVWAASHLNLRRLLHSLESENRASSPLSTQPAAADSTGTTVPRLPYTLPHSASHRLSDLAETTITRWHILRSELAPSLPLAFGGFFFSLVLAAQLGRSTLLAAAASLFCALSLISSQQVPRRNPGLQVSLPVFFAWLLGHSVCGNLHVTSAIAAAAFALVFADLSYCYENAPGSHVAWRSLFQLITVGCLIFIRQPLVAGLVALLISPHWLLLPLLQRVDTRERYFQALQPALLASGLLAAAALGYAP